jgi:hypothetical protein
MFLQDWGLGRLRKEKKYQASGRGSAVAIGVGTGRACETERARLHCGRPVGGLHDIGEMTKGYTAYIFAYQATRGPVHGRRRRAETLVYDAMQSLGTSQLAPVLGIGGCNQAATVVVTANVCNLQAELERRHETQSTPTCSAHYTHSLQTLQCRTCCQSEIVRCCPFTPCMLYNDCLKP